MVNLSITLEAWQPNRMTLPAVQGEEGARSVTVTFLDCGGKPVCLTGCTPRLYLAGTNPPVFCDGTVSDAEGGTAVFVLTSGMTARFGVYACQFLLSGPTFKALKFYGPVLKVERSDLEEAVEATDGFSALTSALNRAESTAKQAAQAASDAAKAVADAGSALQQAEQAAARSQNLPEIGADGYWYVFSTESGRYEKTQRRAALIPKGAWVPGTYGVGDCVYYAPGNAAYCSMKEGNTAVPANDGTNWALLIAGNGAATDNNFSDAEKAKVDAAVPNTRQIAGLPLSGDISLSQLTAAGLASGDSIGNALNALKLGGTDASDYALKDYGHSFNGSGYVRLPNGLILEWITFTTPSVAAGTNYNVSLPVSHIASLLFAVGNVIPLTAWNFGLWEVAPADSSHVNVAVTNGPTVQSFGVRALAIGY